MACTKEGKKSGQTRDFVPEMFSKTQRDCHDTTVCMADSDGKLQMHAL